MVVRTLGDFHAIRDRVEITPGAWGRRKARELLWLLCARPGHAVSRESAAGLLWPDAPSRSQAGRLRVTLHALNQALEPDRTPHAPTAFIHADADLIRLDSAVWLDIDEFHRLARLAGAERDAARMAGLARATVAFYRGPFLADAPCLEWAQSIREAAQATYLDLAVHAGRAELAAGMVGRAAALARSVISTDPYREVAYRLLAQACLATGDPAAARAVFVTCRARLAADLGVRPSWTVDALAMPRPRGTVPTTSVPLPRRHREYQ